MNRLQRHFLIFLSKRWANYIGASILPDELPGPGPLAGHWESTDPDDFIGTVGDIRQAELMDIAIRQFRIFIWMGDPDIEAKYYQGVHDTVEDEVGDKIEEYYAEAMAPP